MENIVIWLALIIVTGFMVGCEDSGYLITINTNGIKYNDLKSGIY